MLMLVVAVVKVVCFEYGVKGKQANMYTCNKYWS